ncbi:MAG: 2-polyprenyl-3-methyl-6-methoxy-1,4-benzoquinone monooxygenase, partial [Burkholderiales bacterium]
MRMHSTSDLLLGTIGRAIHTLCATPAATRSPAQVLQQTTVTNSGPLSESEQAKAAALMRVNHVGEVCAQALYQGHALSTADPELKAFFMAAAQEESDHLAWTKGRLDQLGGRVSALNPIWYAGALAIGYLSGRFGDRASLGFMRETERQVEAHLDSHLEDLPEADLLSRQIVQAM